MLKSQGKRPLFLRLDAAMLHKFDVSGFPAPENGSCAVGVSGFGVKGFTAVGLATYHLASKHDKRG